MHIIAEIKNMGFWQRALVAVVALSVLIGAAGIIFKSSIVEALPAASEAAEPPVGILRFLDSAYDSWKPMALALKIFHSPSGERLYETLRDFQVSGNTGLAGNLDYFNDSKKFQYPLTSLLPIEALNTFGLGSLRVLNMLNLTMFLGCLAATGYLAVLLAREAGYVGRDTSQHDVLKQMAIFALAAAVALTFHPAFMSLVKGNMQIWINCFFALACVAWVKRHQFAAGVFIALATAIKPQLGALLLWALLWRRWSFAAGFVAAGLPIVATAVAYFGLHNNLTYLDLLSIISRHGESFVFNESVNGIVHRLIESDPSRFLQWSNDYGPYHPAAYAFTLLSGALFAIIAFLPAWLRREEEPTVADFSLASICFTIGSPIVWPMHYGILMPIFVIAMFLALREPQAERKTTAVVLGGAWILCATYLPFARLIYERPWNLISNPHFFGGLLLMVALFRVGQMWPMRRPVKLGLPYLAPNPPEQQLGAG